MTTTTRNFFITNFGCRVSQSEGAAIEQELLDANASLADSPYSANVVVINSCTVTAEADKEARQLIRRIASRNPAAQIIVTGCYAQRAPDEISTFPSVRYVVGNSHKPIVGSLALKALEEDFPSHGRAEVVCSNIFLEHELTSGEHRGSGGRTRAIMKVQDGCNANCSFCIIPSVRGRSRSMEVPIVLKEVADLTARGYKEVVFSGIHLGTYGRDLLEKTSFFDLLNRVLVANPGLQRLRLSSIEPLEVTPELVELVARHPRVAHHMHIPLQSGSARILREMRRPYAPAYYASLVQSVRVRVPDASIGADVMVGFPGETDSDFAETYRLIEQSPLTYLHVFPYSSRPGTAAADLSGHVPDHVAHFRGKTLRQLIGKKNETFRESMIGRRLPVLVLEPGEALSDNFLRVHVPRDLPVNEWSDVEVEGLVEGGVKGF